MVFRHQLFSGIKLKVSETVCISSGVFLSLCLFVIGKTGTIKSLRSNDSDDERFEILENGTLIIRDVHLEDEAKYGCTIGNSAGLKREETSLTVRRKYCFYYSNPGDLTLDS